MCPLASSLPLSLLTSRSRLRSRSPSGLTSSRYTHREMGDKRAIEQQRQPLPCNAGNARMPTNRICCSALVSRPEPSRSCAPRTLTGTSCALVSGHSRTARARLALSGLQTAATKQHLSLDSAAQLEYSFIARGLLLHAATDIYWRSLSATQFRRI